MVNKSLQKLLLILSLLIFCTSFQQKKIPRFKNAAIIKLVFVNTINANQIVLNDSIYTNPFGEKYNITKLKYYITNISFQNDKTFFKEKDSYHLIDESIGESKTINLSLPAGDYTSLYFLFGVDSLHNVSGAQSGDLDPDKDMFWTWNSGYVMAKMEGNSPSSNQVNNKFEFHIGGFSGMYNVLKEIRLSLPVSSYHFASGKVYKILIDADIDSWWQSQHDIKIAEHPVVTTPGTLAKNISDNYANMFHLKKIIAQ